MIPSGKTVTQCAQAGSLARRTQLRLATAPPKTVAATLLALGVALILGVGMRLATYGGTILLLLLWGANVPPTDNPLIDEHIIYILVLWLLLMTSAGHYIGIGTRWERTGLVRRIPLLR